MTSKTKNTVIWHQIQKIKQYNIKYKKKSNMTLNTKK